MGTSHTINSFFLSQEKMKWTAMMIKWVAPLEELYSSDCERWEPALLVNFFKEIPLVQTCAGSADSAVPEDREGQAIHACSKQATQLWLVTQETFVSLKQLFKKENISLSLKLMAEDLISPRPSLPPKSMGMCVWDPYMLRHLRSNLKIRKMNSVCLYELSSIHIDV